MDRAGPGERGRPRLYALGDLERLRVRRDARAGHGAVAAGALRWGEPVLDSAITAIAARGPVYSGHVATEPATGGVFEESAPGQRALDDETVCVAPPGVVVKILRAGLALLAASGRGDSRDIAAPVVRKPASGRVGRSIAAMKGGY